MKALTLTQSGQPLRHFVVGEVRNPKLAKDEVLVRVVAAAVNALDYKMAESGLLIDQYPAVLGCDVAGVVEELGEAKDDKSGLRKGDEVLGFSPPGKPGHGGFAELCALEPGLLLRKPSWMSFQQGAAFPEALFTAGVCLYYHLQLPFPSRPSLNREYVLVWGASGSVGACAVQLATLSGFTVLATTSEENFEYVQGLGAQHVFNYKDHDVVKKIKELVGDNLVWAVDTVGPHTADLCAKCLTRKHPAFLAVTAGCPAIKPGAVSCYEVNVSSLYSDNDLHAFGLAMKNEFQTLIDQKRLQPPRIIELQPGFEGLLEGLRKKYDGQGGGRKFVGCLSQPQGLPCDAEE